MKYRFDTTLNGQSVMVVYTFDEIFEEYEVLEVWFNGVDVIKIIDDNQYEELKNEAAQKGVFNEDIR